VSEAELSEAKNELLSLALDERQTARGRAFELGEALVSTGDPRAADKRLAAIAAVTADDVQRVAQARFAPQARVDFTYAEGADDIAAYANPVPMPRFLSVPPASGEPAAVKPEGERQPPPPPGPVPDVARVAFVESTLSNGIALVAAQTGGVPIATITVVLPGGSASDPRGKEGLAAFAAALADKGTPTRDARRIAAELERLGASFEADAGTDGEYVSLTAPVANLPAAGAVLADILRNATYPADELERERARTIDELTVAMNDPGSLADMVATRALYGDAPYGGVMTPQSLPGIAQADLIAHRAKWWHPAKAQIVVSGGIAPDTAQALAESLFGDWTSELPAPQPVASPAGLARPARTIVIDAPDMGQSAVVAGVRALARTDADYYPLYLANIVLGSGSNGRLFEEVRTKRGLSYGSYSSLDARSDTGLLMADAQTKHESADEVAQVILDEFGRLSSAPADEEALEKRRVYVSGAFARQLETSAGFNGMVAGLLSRGIAPEEATSIARRLAAVSPQAAAEAAARYVAPDEATLVIVGDAAQFIDALKAIRPNVEVIPADRLDLSGGPLLGPALAE
jgi:zinc protease